MPEGMEAAARDKNHLPAPMRHNEAEDDAALPRARYLSKACLLLFFKCSGDRG
jgi:hypothetical protein